MTETCISLNPKTPLPGRGVKTDIFYFGSEFCQNLLPTPAQFKKARALAGRPVALSTPLLTGDALKAVEAVLRAHPAGKEKLEVVANDLGLIHLAAKKYSGKVSLSLGRVLASYLKSSPDPFLEKFFNENGISRVEADRPDLVRRFSRIPDLSFSYHAPYAFAGVTRFCPWERLWTGKKCGFSCLRGARKLQTRLLPETLYLVNAGYFTAGEKPGGGRIDRLVYDL